MNGPMVMVALDQDQLALARLLYKSKYNIGFKLNLDYLLNIGIKNAGTMFKYFGRPLFADVKMWNGKRTMLSVLEQLYNARFDYANTHILAATEIPRKNHGHEGLKLLGVALLTHYDCHYGQEYFGKSTGQVITALISRAQTLGLDGVIAKAGYLYLAGQDMIKVAPGIRPSWYKDERHPNPITPTMAVKMKTDILVIGSPITKADDPVAALDRIFEEMISASTSSPAIRFRLNSTLGRE